METRYFLTVDWCNKGNRGVFCSAGGSPFSKESTHTKEEMIEILGVFEMILNPKSEPFTPEELKEYHRYRPLAEYTNHYGVASKS